MMSSRTKSWLEITAVIITAAGKFVFMDYLNIRLPYIIVVILFWVAYVFVHTRMAPERVRNWGFRLDNFRRVWGLLLPFALSAIVILIATGYAQDTINPTWHILPVLILYPLWGTIQQFLLISLVAGNLRDVIDTRTRSIEVLIVLGTAVFFGVIHFPYYWLMIGTFILALLYGWVFLKERNVYVLGLFHGWLGALFFYTVVNRDPFVEVFGRYLTIK